MDTFLLFHASLALFSAVVLICAYSDVTHYRIPNLFILVLLGLYPLFVISAPIVIDWQVSLLLGVGFFVVGTLLFSLGVMGGGDVKMMAVCALCAGPQGFIIFLFFMALSGAVMSLFMMSRFRDASAYVCGRLGLESVHQKLMTPQLPYGVAIACGGLAYAYQFIVIAA